MQKIINKKAQGGVIATVIIVLLVLAVGGIGYWAVSQSGVGGESDEDPLACAESTATISFNAINKLQSGTQVPSVTFYVQKENADGTFGVASLQTGNSTSHTVGKKIRVLAVAANYIDTVIDANNDGQADEITVKCGGDTLDVPMYTTNTNTFRVFNTAGNPLTDQATHASGTTDQTGSASPINLQVYIDSRVDESTGDLVISIESDNTTQVKDIVLSGNSASVGTTPKFYSNAAAGSTVASFDVPQLIEGESKSFTLALSPEASQTIGLTGSNMTTYITAYSKEWFVDTDGTFKYGIENADGTSNYEDTWDFDFVSSLG